MFVEQPAPAEPLASELPLGSYDRCAHRCDDELFDAAFAERLRIGVVVPQQLGGMPVAAVGQSDAQAPGHQRAAALEWCAERLQLSRLEAQLGLQVVECRRAR